MTYAFNVQLQSNFVAVSESKQFHSASAGQLHTGAAAFSKVCNYEKTI